MKACRVALIAAAAFSLCPQPAGAELPRRYYELMQAGIAEVEEYFAREAPTDLGALEARPGWRHFPSSLLVAATLYSKAHPANPRHRDPKMLELAKKIGDLVAADNEKGNFTKRLDHHRNLYMWLDSYRLLERELEPQQRAFWRRELGKNLTDLETDVTARADFGAYISPFLQTSPNHYSLWSSTLYLAGKVFGNRRWEELSGRVLHRFATEDQAPDGYWGEHDRTGPTPGYNYLTFTAMALYWEHSNDPAALEALRRGTEFHKNYTYPDGQPVEVLDDRNRYWSVSPWGHFGFSNFPDGRGYAEFLTSFFEERRLGMETLGRIAQSALYWREGPSQPAPQTLQSYQHRMTVSAGIRKTGPWVVCLSGLISTQAPTNRFYLDRQGHLSVFHEKLGMILTGANSKRQPELATFRELTQGELFHMPTAARLRMSDRHDRLSLAFHTFFSDLYVDPPASNELRFRFVVTPMSRRDQAELNLQLRLKPGATLETGAGRTVTLGAERIELGPRELGGWVRHQGWTLRLDPSARLVWPVFPHNPYSNAPEKNPERAVGVLSVPVLAQRPSGEPLGAGAQEISFVLLAN